MKVNHVCVLTLAAAMMASGSVPAVAAEESVVVTKAELKWKDMGVTGLVAAPVSGDMEKGPSRFFLKYPAGFVSPKHHHSADHYVTMVSGTITLTVDGKDHKVGPGSYFAITGAKPHVARVEGNEEAVFFIQADGPWDVVMDP